MAEQIDETSVTSEDTEDQPVLQAERRRGTDVVVFSVAALIALAFVLWGVIDTKSLKSVSSDLLKWITTNTGWAFVLAASGFVVFAIYLACSRYGRIPLGRDDEKPEFKTVSWVAMMFSAGMGIGLMFYGAAEPLNFFVSPPPGGPTPQSNEALSNAMATALFHWTVHPWAIYAVVGLAIAYGTFRRGRSQLISSAFAPLFGKRVAEGPLGKSIDIMAIFATLFGSAASLGLGALQIGSGLQAVGWVGELGVSLLVGVIAVLTIAFVASAVSGVAKGIQWLSNINMVLAGILAFAIFVIGPTVLILNLVPTALGNYVRDMGEMAARTGATGGTSATGQSMDAWLGEWTIFYWAWWISWTPFVGMFIARISRGRSIRQFIGGVIAVPSVVSLVWFAIFGGAALHQQRVNNLAQRGDPYNTPEKTLFVLLEDFQPYTTILAVLVVILVAIFFVSGADAASVVMGTLSQRGSIAPSRPVVIFWGVLTGAVAAVMLLVGGLDEGKSALTGLRNLTIIAAAPFAVVMILLCVALAKDLRSDPLVHKEKRIAEVLDEATAHDGPGAAALRVPNGDSDGDTPDGDDSTRRKE
ncbi:choline/carnitine/betaine transport [Herbihabitans rhizosphaerae]|uniref:Choline/carnitine/betaine transport n=1 Tax=Herbihabitans rhizosphaerae TaxID=1872711 RepID=A0A4Q7KLW0_9PSEU|nr:BCCT family transporter [Herbihabitans rhizosphaerae]RZS37515.1 choline/carnitine/betaine transport [Herbihabitans rhizosphaerae]